MKEATKQKKIKELEALIKKAEDKIVDYKSRIKKIKDTPAFTYKERSESGYYRGYYIKYKKKWVKKNPNYMKDRYKALTPKQKYEANSIRKFDTYEEMIANRKYKNSKEFKLRRLREHNASWGGGVYLIVSSGGNYVGYSKQLRARKDQHSCKKPRPDSPIAGVYKLLEFKILEKTTDKLREQYWIDKLKPDLNQRSAKKS